MIARQSKAEKYLRTFFEEKDLPEVVFEVESPNGTANMIPSELVIDVILNSCPADEQERIANMIRRLDFANADILDYLKHLARALARDL